MPTLIPTKLVNALLLITFGLLGIPAASTAVESIPAFSVTYTLENKFIKGGEANFRLAKKEDHFQLVLETKPTGVFRLSNKGKVMEVAELPSLYPPFLATKYSYINFGDQDRSYTSMYNRKKSEATIVRDANAKRFFIDPIAVDRLSMTLTIMHRLREQPDIDQFSIATLGTKGTQTVSFASKGREKLKTAIGTLDTIRIDRLRNNDSNRKTITWFATVGESNIPIPVQIEQFKRGKLTVRLKIKDFSTTD